MVGVVTNDCVWIVESINLPISMDYDIIVGQNLYTIRKTNEGYHQRNNFLERKNRALWRMIGATISKIEF